MVVGNPPISKPPAIAYYEHIKQPIGLLTAQLPLHKTDLRK